MKQIIGRDLFGRSRPDGWIRGGDGRACITRSLKIGRRFVHDIRRTVTETDNILFSTLTHNPAALHLDAEASRAWAVRAGFGEQRIHARAAGGCIGRRYDAGYHGGQSWLGSRFAFPSRCSSAIRCACGNRSCRAAREPVTSRMWDRGVQACRIQPAGRAGGELFALRAHEEEVRTSFSRKRSKKLLFRCQRSFRKDTRQGAKVFCFFFLKKKPSCLFQMWNVEHLAVQPDHARAWRRVEGGDDAPRVIELRR